MAHVKTSQMRRKLLDEAIRPKLMDAVEGKTTWEDARNRTQLPKDVSRSANLPQLVKRDTECSGGTLLVSKKVVIHLFDVFPPTFTVSSQKT